MSPPLGDYFTPLIFEREKVLPGFKNSTLIRRKRSLFLEWKSYRGSERKNHLAALELVFSSATVGDKKGDFLVRKLNPAPI